MSKQKRSHLPVKTQVALARYRQARIEAMKLEYLIESMQEKLSCWNEAKNDIMFKLQELEYNHFTSAQLDDLALTGECEEVSY